MRMNPAPLVAIAAFFLAGTVSAQAPAPTLEERMSRSDFESAGLDRLTPEQLRFLNEWLGSKGISASVAPVKRSDGSMLYYPDPTARDTVHSRIVGEFNGWSGRTTVTLENGQKWQQSESVGRGDVRMSNPEVTIKPMSMGSWLMVVKGCNCSIRVKRVG